MSESDEQLVTRTRQGDRTAFSRLVQRYEKAAIAVAQSVLRCLHDSRDVVQEAFLVAYQRINRLWVAGKFGPWLLRIVKRQALWHRRKGMTGIGPMQALNVDPAAPKHEESGGAMGLIGRLPAHECVVVSLRHLEDLSVAEIAKATGRPIGTVTKQLSRAYARLRVWVEGQR